MSIKKDEGGGFVSLFQKHPTVVDAEQIPSGWKIEVEGGDKIFLSDFTFKRLYYPVGKDKCKYCKHGRRHELHTAMCDTHEACMFQWLEGENDE